MKIQQIAIFMENKPGHLTSVCRTLAENDISITTLSLADTQQYGILRIVTESWAKAKEVLEKGGYVVNVTEVLAVEVVDKPGGLLQILDIISEGEINIEYMYAFTFRYGEKAIMVFRFNDPDKAIDVLQKQGITVLNSIELFNGIK
jgi:ACT domain-containing protein